MQPAIQQLIAAYQSTTRMKKDVLHEVLQHCALMGLARRKFFKHAAFYGGTALRLLYGLDRFSEDLDFSLLEPDPTFDFDPYLQGLETELQAFGFSISVQSKKKNPPILSAFVKSNTLKLLMSLEDSTSGIHPEEKISIKLEIDTNPPAGFETENKLVLTPTPFYVRTYLPQDLFAGKMHAILCRDWKGRIKGRDWYDLCWFIAKKIPLHLSHLKQRLQQSGHLAANTSLTESHLLSLLQKKIASIDWASAVRDVQPFIANQETLALWGPPFFLEVISQLQFSN